MTPNDPNVDKGTNGQGGGGGGGQGRGEGPAQFFSPVFLTALLILMGVFFVIGMTIVGWDRGNVLRNMGQVEYARGLITYLFAVVTIGTAVVLVVSALSHIADPNSDEKFQRAKEVLSLLLGIFGTIVGYYFGSEKSALPALRLIAPAIKQVPADGTFTLTTAVVGGTSPYSYKIAVGTKTITENKLVNESGLIIHESTKEDLAGLQAGTNTLEISVTDASGRSASARKEVEVARDGAKPGKK